MIEKAGESQTALSVSGELVFMGEVPQTWVTYTRDDGKIVLLCKENNMALGCTLTGNLIMVEPEAENECRFEVVEHGNGSLLVSETGALTMENGVPVIRPVEADNASQEWMILPVKTECAGSSDADN